MRNKKLFVLLLVLCLPVFTSAQSTPQILVIYNTPAEFSYFTTQMMEFDNVRLVQINSLIPSDIQGATAIIFASSIDFSLPDDIEDELTIFVNTPGKGILIVTPFLDEMEDALKLRLGISDFDGVYPSDKNATWQIQLLDDVGQYTGGQSFSYTGKVGVFETTQSVLATATNTSGIGEDSLEFAPPVIVNATTSQQSILTLPISPIEGTLTPSRLGVDQVPFIDVVGALIAAMINVNLPQIISNVENTAATDATNSGNNPVIAPLQSLPPDLLRVLLYGILALALAIVLRVWKIFSWLARKAWGVVFFFVGAYYNIQERTLDYAGVMMNASRQDILAYLEHMDYFGAHLREIKNVTRMGTGSLLWHLQVLEDYHIVDKYNIGDYTVFITADAINRFDPRMKEVELKLQSKYTKDVVRALNECEQGMISLGELEERTQINRRSLLRLIKRMDKLGLVELIKGKSYVVAIQDKEAINYLNESFKRKETYANTSNSISVSSLGD